MVEDAIKQLLTTDAQITALVTKVRPVCFGQNDSLPYVAYQVIDAENMDNLSSAGAHRRELVQIDIYAMTSAQANSIREKIRSRLHLFVGAAGGIQVDLIVHQSNGDLTPPAENGNENPVRHLTSDFRVTYH